MSQVRTRLHLGPGRITFERVQDCEPILQRNKELRALPQRADWGRHIASIPNVIIEKWMREDGVNILGLSAEEWGRFIRRKLDDPDWRHLRTDR